MIERHWKGITSPENSDNYVQHLLEDTFVDLSKIEGFKKASILKRVINGSVEFLVITRWESMASIKKFTGENTEVAVVPLKAQKLLTSYDLNVSHYEKVGV